MHLDRPVLALKECFVFTLLFSFQRNLTFSCAESHTFPAFFNSTSTLQLPGRTDADTVSVRLRFRTWNPSGLLFFTPLMPGGVEVSLVEGKVTVHIYIALEKNTRVDISSGNVRSLKVFNGFILLSNIYVY